MAKIALVVGIVAVCSGAALAVTPQCAFDSRLFSAGAVTCQRGEQFRCKSDGNWQDVGLGCAGESPGVDNGSDVVVDPAVKQPKVHDPGLNVPAVRQPGAPTVSPD